jgi:hypothetical protein
VPQLSRRRGHCFPIREVHHPQFQNGQRIRFLASNLPWKIFSKQTLRMQSTNRMWNEREDFFGRKNSREPIHAHPHDMAKQLPPSKRFFLLLCISHHLEFLGNRRSEIFLHRQKKIPHEFSIASNPHVSRSAPGCALRCILRFSSNPAVPGKTDSLYVAPRAPSGGLQFHAASVFSRATPNPGAAHIPAASFRKEIYLPQRRRLHRRYPRHASNSGRAIFSLVVRNRPSRKTLCPSPRPRLLRHRPGPSHWRQLAQLENEPLSSLA